MSICLTAIHTAPDYIQIVIWNTAGDTDLDITSVLS